MKRIRVVVLVSMVTLYLLADKVVDSGDYEYKIVNYVALGDSIAKGYGLKDVDTESYVGRVAKVLENRYGAVNVANFGENGLRSDELLGILEQKENEQHKEYIEKIQKADIITLSIGSNDLLQYVSWNTDFEEFRKRGDEIFTNACLRFQDNIPRIIDVIRQEAPQAQLFVNNVYNPCNDISFEYVENLSADLGQLAETYVEKINDGFEQEQVQQVFANNNEEKAWQQYVFIDVKRAFDKSDMKLINMAFDWGKVDPHPNAAGHEKIADLIIPRISLNK